MIAMFWALHAAMMPVESKPRQAVGMVVVVAALAVVIRHDVRDRPLRLAPSTIASPPPRE